MVHPIVSLLAIIIGYGIIAPAYLKFLSKKQEKEIYFKPKKLEDDE